MEVRRLLNPNQRSSRVGGSKISKPFTPNPVFLKLPHLALMEVRLNPIQRSSRERGSNISKPFTPKPVFLKFPHLALMEVRLELDPVQPLAASGREASKSRTTRGGAVNILTVIFGKNIHTALQRVRRSPQEAAN